MGEEWGPCRFHYYAARDITAGEELLLHYADFEDVSQQGWVEIGLSEGRQEEEEVVYEDGDYLIDEGDEYNNNDDDNTDDDNHNDENGL
jgi:SET domain-containing protein